jgi:hypothetical protein
LENRGLTHWGSAASLTSATHQELRSSFQRLDGCNNLLDCCIPSLGLEYGNYQRSELRNACPHDVPHDLVIDAELAMYEAIAHSGNLPPVDRGVLRPELRWELLGRLSYHFQAPDECTLCNRARVEIRCRKAVGLPYQEVSLFENVPEIITQLEGHPSLPPGSSGR